MEDKELNSDQIIRLYEIIKLKKNEVIKRAYIKNNLLVIEFVDRNDISISGIYCPSIENQQYIEDNINYILTGDNSLKEGKVWKVDLRNIY